MINNVKLIIMFYHDKLVTNSISGCVCYESKEYMNSRKKKMDLES
jgi:hypothetical protein